jgi:hypothetical protein
MSGETKELTDDGSVNSALVWAENPELEYFRAMMNNQMDIEGSLIGESTIKEHFDGQEILGPNHPAAGRRPSSEKNKLEAVNTSGLSVNENDTVENIHTLDGSLQDWFANNKIEKDIDVAFEVGTLETPPDIFPRFDPATGTFSANPQYRTQGGQPTNHQQQFYSGAHSPLQFQAAGQYDHPDNIAPEAPHIPGFIFVTSGNSCAVQTKGGSKESTHPLSKSIFCDDSAADDDEEDAQHTSSRWGCGRITVISVLVGVIIAATIFAILFSQQSNSLETSSAAAEAEAPSWVPRPAATTASTSTLTPTSINRNTPAPSEEEPVSNPSKSPSPVFRPSSRPVTEQTDDDTTPSPTTTSVVVRIEIMSPGLMDSLTDPDSPQLLALEWLMNETQVDLYSDNQLRQRFVLATFFFSTDGTEWTKASSWLEEGTDECDWWGIDCDDSGGVTALRLSKDNLSGPIPPEIHLLSDTLEEIFFDDNNISGTIPASVGRLSRLERLQLKNNQLQGTLPTELGNLESIRLLSFKDNDITGTIPSEIGQLKVIRK